jgi:hypothetical protein
MNSTLLGFQYEHHSAHHSSTDYMWGLRQVLELLEAHHEGISLSSEHHLGKHLQAHA